MRLQLLERRLALLKPHGFLEESVEMVESLDAPFKDDLGLVCLAAYVMRSIRLDNTLILR
jgi:hypothetical protein